VVDLPASLEIIGYNAFLGSAHTLIIRSVSPPVREHDKGEDFGTISASVIYVPDESLEAYKQAPLWKDHVQKLRPLSEYPG
jgi:hypothetical protein